jgi:hypothetical protein
VAPVSFSWPGAQSRALVEPAPLFSWPGALSLEPGAEAGPDLQAVDGARVAGEAAAPVASAPERVLGDTPVRSGKPPELVVEGGAGESEDGVRGAFVLALGAPPAAGPAWAKAIVTAPAARAVAAQSVVMVRIWESSLRSPAALTTGGSAFGSPGAHQLCRWAELGRRGKAAVSSKP